MHLSPKFLVLFGVLLLVLAGSHFFLWHRLGRAPQWGPRVQRAIGILLTLLGLSIPAGLALGRFADDTLGRGVAALGYTWMGLLFYFMVGLAGVDVATLGLRVGRKALGLGRIAPDRKVFLARAVAGALTAGVLLVGGVGIVTANGTPNVQTVEVTLDGLPPALDGFTIVQLSDLHVGPTIRRERVQALVAQTNALHPDLIALTGDFVDGSVASLRDQVAPLADLKATHGTYFVTGNHETYSGANQWLDEFRRLGLHTLRNERVWIGNRDAGFDLAGVDDPSSFQAEGRGADVALALRGHDPRNAVVLLSHQPTVIDQAAKHAVGLMLSGHTHGGQIWPFGFLVGLQQPYMQGLHRRGNTWLYVSRGVGYWGPPMRLGAPPEVTRIVLRASSKPG
jgi:predicted MPP superfamily phosphohydrolase